MNIFQRMSAITTELTAVAKNLQVGEGRFSYKAVGEADVLAAVKPLEAKHGVYSYPYSRTIEEANVITTVNNGKETSKFLMRVKTVYRFVNMDKPDEYIDITTYGDGVDPQDKAPGKAMTYGDKYALLKAYKIITGDDPDQFKSEEVKKIEYASPADKKMLISMCEQLGVDAKELSIKAGVKPGEKMTTEQYGKALRILNGEG